MVECLTLNAKGVGSVGLRLMLVRTLSCVRRVVLGLLELLCQIRVTGVSRGVACLRMTT